MPTGILSWFIEGLGVADLKEAKALLEELSAGCGNMRCSKCRSENREGRSFCGNCGEPLQISCSKCGGSNQAREKFCGECGTMLGLTNPTARLPTGSSSTTHSAIADQPASLFSEGERKTVTALFADIKGSTELMRDLDPEEARAIVDPVLQLMIAAVHRYDGYVVQSMGDGIFSLFGAPVAHEDHAQRAVHAALAIQQDLLSYGARLDNRAPSRVEARIGINTGEVVLRLVHTGGHTEYAPVGHAANLAARMQSVAPIGGIVLSEETRHLVTGYFELRGMGPTDVKGVEKPINVYEVVGAGTLRDHFEVAVRRGLTKFVGREREIAAMHRSLEVMRSGNAQILAMVGEAGAGKSRLLYEFRATIPSECKLLEAYPVSHGHASPWLPVLELLRNYFKLQDSDDAPRRREKIRASLIALDPALSDALPYLFNLLAIQEQSDPLGQIDPQMKHQRTISAIERIILRESLKQPVLIIFEDLHWIDIETQAFLDHFTEAITNARVLMLVNYRPEYRHQWSNKPNYSEVELQTLTSEAAGAMLTTLVGDSAELDPLKRMIIDRT